MKKKNSIDDLFKSLEGYQATPPKDAWNSISEQLENSGQMNMPSSEGSNFMKFNPQSFNIFYAAAIAIGVATSFLFETLQFINHENNTDFEKNMLFDTVQVYDTLIYYDTIRKYETTDIDKPDIPTPKPLFIEPLPTDTLQVEDTNKHASNILIDSSAQMIEPANPVVKKVVKQKKVVRKQKVFIKKD